MGLCTMCVHRVLSQMWNVAVNAKTCLSCWLNHVAMLQRRKRKREAAGDGGSNTGGGGAKENGRGRDAFQPGGPKYCRFVLCKENMDRCSPLQSTWGHPAVLF